VEGKKKKTTGFLRKKITKYRKKKRRRERALYRAPIREERKRDPGIGHVRHRTRGGGEGERGNFQALTKTPLWGGKGANPGFQASAVVKKKKGFPVLQEGDQLIAVGGESMSPKNSTK